MRLGVRFDLQAFKRDLDQKGRKRVDRAAGIALRKVGVSVRKVASDSIRQKLAIKAAIAKKAITIRRSGNKLTLFIEASGSPIPLREYGARQTAKGVSYKVSKTRGRRIYENKFGKGFIVERLGGHVFARVEPEPKGVKRAIRSLLGRSKRAKIRKIYGPSVPQYFVTRIIRQLLLAKARERWPIEFAAAWRGLSIRAGQGPGQS